MNPGTLSRVRRRTLVVAGAVVAVLAVVLAVLAVDRHGPAASPSAGSAFPASASRSPGTARPPAGMATVPLGQLPPEAQQVVRKIDAGGPFQNRQDGTTFGNRERRLPREPDGYYREYTVPTPGAVDRGARRVISGRQGELYYTSDHYATFQWIIRSSKP